MSLKFFGEYTEFHFVMILMVVRGALCCNYGEQNHNCEMCMKLSFNAIKHAVIAKVLTENIKNKTEINNKMLV